MIESLKTRKLTFWPITLASVIYVTKTTQKKKKKSLVILLCLERDCVCKEKDLCALVCNFLPCQHWSILADSERKLQHFTAGLYMPVTVNSASAFKAINPVLPVLKGTSTYSRFVSKVIDIRIGLRLSAKEIKISVCNPT